jgi:hypothetical protein
MGMVDDKRYWLDDWRNVRKVLWTLYAACAVLIALDLLYRRHAVLDFEGWFGFYAIYGFVACVALVLTAKGLRKLIARPLDYYESEEDAGGES